MVACDDTGDNTLNKGEAVGVEAKKKNKKKRRRINLNRLLLKKVEKVLGVVSVNTSDEKLCAFCKKTGPTKRWSKRHSKCLPKMFCNETCESLAHVDKKAATVKKESSKVAVAKIKGMKSKDCKNTDSGQFWWHDQ